MSISELKGDIKKWLVIYRNNKLVIGDKAQANEPVFIAAEISANHLHDLIKL